jgi:hypothetical protein
MDLLHELRRSKEEADWAKQKLAEAIVRLGEVQKAPTTAASPGKAKKGAKEAPSPVQPVRPALRFSNPVVSTQGPPVHMMSASRPSAAKQR